MVAIWGGTETSCFFRRGGFVPLSVVPLFESSDVDGSLANGEACKCQAFYFPVRFDLSWGRHIHSRSELLILVLWVRRSP
jgi:hypothetical protein